MTTLTHDPEFPYVFRFSSGDKPTAKFRNLVDAQIYAENYTYGSVVDTTPKPKIPGGAKYITWIYPSGLCGIAHSTEGYWVLQDVEVGYEELLEEIGDSEVTVLVPKEER